jgi:hypothetical protein
MISSHLINSIFVGKIRSNRQLFHSYGLSSFTDITKAESAFIHISDFFLVDKSPAISQPLVIEVTDKVCTFLQAISNLLHQNMANCTLLAVYKKLPYDFCWLIFTMDKNHWLFTIVTSEIVCTSLIVLHLDLDLDLDMPESSFMIFNTKLSNDNRNVAMLPNSNILASQFELVINDFYVSHYKPAVFSKHGFSLFAVNLLMLKFVRKPLFKPSDSPVVCSDQLIYTYYDPGNFYSFVKLIAYCHIWYDPRSNLSYSTLDTDDGRKDSPADSNCYHCFQFLSDDIVNKLDLSIRSKVRGPPVAVSSCFNS